MGRVENKYKKGDEVYIKQSIVGYIQRWREDLPDKYTIKQVRRDIPDKPMYSISHGTGYFNQDQLVSPEEVVLVALETRGEYEEGIRRGASEALSKLWERVRILREVVLGGKDND